MLLTIHIDIHTLIIIFVLHVKHTTINIILLIILCITQLTVLKRSDPPWSVLCKHSFFFTFVSSIF